ncbi:MAG: dTDP-4-dehydrorhamnose reductase [Pseudomonadota bacterium]
MNILITGSTGQVGYELQRQLAGVGRVTAVDRQQCNLADADSIRACIDRVEPDWIINAGAWTAVDKAETEREAAFAINAAAPRLLAELAAARGARLVHYSTDYVFAGDKPGRYREDDPVQPLNVYGASKLAGEQAIAEMVASRDLQAWTFRTTWVFGTHGNNFLKTMLKLAQTRDSLSVVNDQFGAPTSAALIAQVTARLISRVSAGTTIAPGLYHLAAAGETNWQAYARRVIAQARAHGLSTRVAPEQVQGIPAVQYPTPAARPANSRLDCQRLESALSMKLPDWTIGVDAVVADVVQYAT